jgi:hypothetical protein
VTPASLEPLDVLRLDGLFGEAKRVTADYAFETKTRGASEQAETTPLKGWHEPADPATAGENGRRFRVPGYLSDLPDDSESRIRFSGKIMLERILRAGAIQSGTIPL